MQIIGCDLHARQQTLAMLDTGTGEVVNRTLTHEGNSVREFYSAERRTSERRVSYERKPCNSGGNPDPNHDCQFAEHRNKDGNT